MARVRRRAVDPTGRARFGLWLSLAPALWLFAFFLVPLGILVAWSFQPPGIRTYLVPQWTADAYALTLGVGGYWSLLWKTVFVALTVAAAAVILGYPIAYTLALVAGRRRYLLMGLVFLPFLTSYLLRIFAWRLLLGRRGVFNVLLQSVDLIRDPVDFLLFSRAAVVVVLIYVWAPWAALPIFVRLERMDRTLLEAAADLGATGPSRFLRVTLPLSLPAVFISFLFVFIPTLGDFATASAVGGAQGQMIGNIIQHFLNELSYPSGAVLSVLLLMAAFALMAVAFRFLKIRAMSDIGV